MFLGLSLLLIPYIVECVENSLNCIQAMQRMICYNQIFNLQNDVYLYYLMIKKTIVYTNKNMYGVGIYLYSSVADPKIGGPL